MLFVRSRMPPSRQERRKAGRDAAKHAKRAPASDVAVNPLDDWSTQTEDPTALLRELGREVVRQRAAAGDAEAQWSLGFRYGLNLTLKRARVRSRLWARAADRRKRIRAWRFWRRQQGKGMCTLRLCW